MNQFFENGPKNLNVNAMSQNNAIMQSIDDSIFMKDQINHKLQGQSNFQQQMSYADYKNLIENQQDPQYSQMQQFNAQGMEEQWNNMRLDNTNPQSSNILFQKQNSGSQVQNNFPETFMPQMHPSLSMFNDMLAKEMANKETEKVDKQEEKNEKFESVYQEIIDVMESQDDERHHNSEFLKFIKKLNTGEIKLNEKENTITTNSGITSDTDKMFKNLEEEIFNQSMQPTDHISAIFHPVNKYNNDKLEIDRVELAKEHLRKFESEEARLLLEAECKVNPDNSEAWLLLGKYHSDQDNDESAYICFNQAYKVDPYNFDCLLALGVSCTNKVEEFDAMIYLLEYIKQHPIYSKCFDSNNKMLDYKLIKENMQAMTNDDVDFSWGYEMRSNMNDNFCKEIMDLYSSISQNESIMKTSDFYLSYGILNFIPHNYEQSVSAFKKAVEMNPNDYSCWNKLGAIYAHSGMNDSAIDCYLKSIQLKPDYARGYSNLCLAMNTSGNKNEAVKFGLKALKYSPSNQFSDNWGMLSSIFDQTGSKQDYQLCSKRDLAGLLSKYNI